ncbi:MAG: hypothetical protein ACRDD2_12935 [Sarcina sp.]
MKKIKKKTIIISVVSIVIIGVTIEWNSLIVKKFNNYITNKLKIAEIESNSNNQYIDFGYNMVVNYNGQVQDKGQIYNQLVEVSQNMLIKNSIYLGSPIIKVDFNAIKIMSGIKYYPIQVFVVENNQRVLKYSFYSSLEGNLIPTDRNLGINDEINMVNDFGNNSGINQSYLLNSNEIAYYNDESYFDINARNLYYRLCEMAKLNIFGTNYVNNYSFVINLVAPVTYNNEPYYEIFMYNNKYKNEGNGGLLYKFYMSASGNIVSYDLINQEQSLNQGENTNANNNTNNSTKVSGVADTNKATTSRTVAETTENNSTDSTKNENKVSLDVNKISKNIYNNLYKLSMEYENLIPVQKTTDDFKIKNIQEVNKVDYYEVEIIKDNSVIDSFWITENGNVVRKLETKK